MNYLAHLFVAGKNPDHLVGHMLGDFVRPREIAAYEPGIQAGIRMHQRVDAFSDSHAAFARSRRRFQPPHRRYAGVLVDLVYDHFLAAHWEDYSPEPLSDFTRRAYAVLASREAILPARLQGMLPRMIADDWLSAYRDLDNVGRALRGISHRLRRANPLGDSLAALRANYAGLEKDFHEFFPELAAFSADIVAASIHDNGKHVSRGANFRG